MKKLTSIALAFVSVLLVSGSALAAGKDVGVGKKFKGPIGLQLYSLRGDFSKDVAGTLDKVKDFGFKYVELAGTYKLSPQDFRKMLDDRKLVAISGHFPYDRFRDDVEGIAKEAKVLGLKYAGCAWITHQAPFDEKQARAAAEVFNKAGAALKKHGIKFFYHIHGYEFHPHQQGTLFDLLVQETDPQHVTFEIDVFWVVHPGHDPAKLIAKYPRRFELMHVKDMKKGTQTGILTGKSDVNNDVAIGTGMMDWPAILKAAKKAGLKYYFIEDESDAAAAHVPESLKFLETVDF